MSIYVAITLTTMKMVYILKTHITINTMSIYVVITMYILITPKTPKKVYIIRQTQQAEYSKAQKNPSTPQNMNETPKSEELSCREKNSNAKYAALTLRQYTVN